MPAKFIVRLTDAERDRLDRLTRTGRAHVRTIAHARALLLTDASDDGPAWTDEKAADALGVSPPTLSASARRRSHAPDAASARRASTKRSAPAKVVLGVRP